MAKGSREERADMVQAGVDELGMGSIIEDFPGNLYVKGADGRWWLLSIDLGTSPVNVARLGTLEVVREVGRNVLSGMEVGTVITFDDGDVAVLKDEDCWRVAGSAADYSSDQMNNYIFDKDSVKVLA